MKQEEEIRVTQPQVKELEGFRGGGALEARKRQGRILPKSLQREHDPMNTLILDFWGPEL